MVFLLAYHFLDPAADDQHRAGPARCHLAVERRSVYRYSQFRCLADGVLLGMDGPDAMVGDLPVFVRRLLELMADFVAMRQSWRRTYISGADYLLVLRYHASAPASVAGSSLRYCPCYLHEILIPCGAYIMLFTHFVSVKE